MLIDADTVVVSIALVAGAVVVARERPKGSSDAAICGLLDFGTNQPLRVGPCLCCGRRAWQVQPPLNPGVLVQLDGDQQTFLGTTFGFRTRLHFLTAAHCVGDLDPSAVAVVLPREPTPLQLFGEEHRSASDGRSCSVDAS